MNFACAGGKICRMVEKSLTYQEVMTKIGNHLMMAGVLRSYKDALQFDVKVPAVIFSNNLRTRNILPQLGLSRLAVIFMEDLAVAHEKLPRAEPDNKAYVSAKEIITEVTEEVPEENSSNSGWSWGYQRTRTHLVRAGYLLALSSPLIHNPQGQRIEFVISSTDRHFGPKEKAQNPFIVMPKNGIDFQRNSALLLVKDEAGLIHVSALTLPERWRSAVENGHLVDSSSNTPNTGSNPALETTNKTDKRGYRRRDNGSHQRKGYPEGIDGGRERRVYRALEQLFPTQSGSIWPSGDSGSAPGHESEQAKKRYWAEKARKKAKKG